MSKYALDKVGEILLKLGYSDELFDVMGVDVFSGAMREYITSIAYAFSNPTTKKIVTRLFYCGAVVPSLLVKQYLGEDLVATILDAGLVRVVSNGYQATNQIIPHDSGFFVCSFVRRATMDGLHYVSDTDFLMVARPNYESYLLSLLRLKNTTLSILDIGLGSGFVALSLGKRTSGPVVGIDPNPEAIRISQINKRLGGRLFRPYIFEESAIEFWNSQKKTFDLIVSNPPHSFWRPATMATEGGVGGQDVTAKVLKRVPELLAPYGILLLTTGFMGGVSKSVVQALFQNLGNSLSVEIYNYARIPLAQYATQNALKKINKGAGDIFEEAIESYNDLSQRSIGDHLQSSLIVVKQAKRKRGIKIVETSTGNLERMLISGALWQR